MRTIQHHVDANGVRIAYETHGDGPTVALLPGWMIANRGSWTAQVRRLAPALRVVTYDGRGTGASDRPARPAAYQTGALVGDALAVLAATTAEPAVLVGNSLGGLVGLLVAAQRPERVAGLVLIGATVDLGGSAPTALQQAITTFDGSVAEDRGWGRYSRAAWRRDYPGFVDWFITTALGPAGDADARAEGIRQGLDVGPDVLAATVDARTGIDRNQQAALSREVVAAVRCPVRVVTGDRDEICPPQWSDQIAAALDTRPIVVPGAGHCPHVTHPDVVADIITRFAQEVLT